jgi:hypothetical protein
MRRLKDFAGFGLWVAGLIYMALTLLSGSHPNAMPDAFQPLGLAAAVFVMVRLILVAVRAGRRPPPKPERSFRMRHPPPTVMRIKSRNHFGLRGIERATNPD